MQGGRVFTADVADATPKIRQIAQLSHPCHVEPCDLDGDGATDLVVAELGSFRAMDHTRGQVVWLRSTGAEYEKVVLASGLGRVADVRPADFDGDGDEDLVVAVFGYSRTGKLLLLRNAGVPTGRPRFEMEVVDPRPGTIHVPILDLNRDGTLDFVSLISQEYESVAAFFNLGDGRFRIQTLWSGPDPTFGSTGIQVIDLDQDGDQDILLTNGDTFDDQYLKPSHGVHWLENLGGSRFAYHRIAHMAGVHRALAGDVDRDGDLDIVAVAWLHDQLYPVSAAVQSRTSVLFLEQTSPGVFVRHSMEMGYPCHAALELADFDGDGDLDIAVGWMLSKKWKRVRRWLTVWRNQAGEATEHRPQGVEGVEGGRSASP